MTDELTPEVLAIHQWIRDDAPVSMKMTITPKLIAALADRLDAARDEGRRAVVGGAVPWIKHHHTCHPWAQPGDEPNRSWILRFSDPDMREMYWSGEDAEKEAKAAYAKYAPAWSVYLFATVPTGLAAAPSPPVADTRAEIIWIDIGIKCPGCGCAIQTGEDWIDMGGGTWSPGDIRSVQGCANGCDIRVEIPDMKIKVADGPA